MSVAKRLIEEQLEENARQGREFVDGAFYWVTRDGSFTIARFDGEVGGFDCLRRFSDETLYPQQLEGEGYVIGPCLGKGPRRHPNAKVETAPGVGSPELNKALAILLNR